MVKMNESEITEKDFNEVIFEFSKFLKSGKVEIEHNSPEFAKASANQCEKENRANPEYWLPKYTKMIRKMKRKWRLLKIKDTKPFIRYGAIVVKKKMPIRKNGILFIGQKNMKPTGLDLRDKIYIPEDCEWDTVRVHYGDVLMARSGVASIGRTEVYRFKEKATVACFVNIIRQNRINPFYLTVFMKSKFGKEYFKNAILFRDLLKDTLDKEKIKRIKSFLKLDE